MKVILCGYHWTGCKALELLLEKNCEVYVYTHKTENYIADLEGLCIKKNIGYTFDKINVDNLPFAPDIICSIYYRYIIDRKVINAVNGKIFNLHPALLPKYRGCSSLTWAMINGEHECGFTYHYIDEGCDTGDIILQKTVKIEDFDTQLTLYNRVMFESMDYFLEVLEMVVKGCAGKPQEGVSSQYKRGCPMDGKITDSMDDDIKERFVRAMCYPPYPAAKYNDKEIATLSDLKKYTPGGIA
jgi:UDP-4-amino-4-deoxy-L-arabinose formyltransferase/UDP-glucuronic acid dehydrogenase (UDP-4-keto-hexauronic acid decarboxylating)